MVFVTENPTTIVLNFKNDNSGFCRNSHIDLRVFAIRFFNIQVMKYCTGVYSSLQ